MVPVCPSYKFTWLSRDFGISVSRLSSLKNECLPFCKKVPSRQFCALSAIFAELAACSERKPSCARERSHFWRAANNTSPSESDRLCISAAAATSVAAIRSWIAGGRMVAFSQSGNVRASRKALWWKTGAKKAGDCSREISTLAGKSIMAKVLYSDLTPFCLLSFHHNVPLSFLVLKEQLVIIYLM